jgi:ankyrin repeat protein
VSTAEPLVQAAANGKLAVVRLLLLELGAEVTQLYEGFTALYVAAQEGHECVVRCIVQEFGADVNQG